MGEGASHDLFFAPGIPEGLHELDAGEARHCAAVLRKRSGDRIELVDGRGARYRAVLTDVDRRRCLFEVEGVETVPDQPAIPVHLAVAPTKNGTRFEWALEKATEIGVTSITPIRCRRSERRRGNPDRWNRVLVAAMKQGGRARLPELRPFADFDDWLAAPGDSRFIAHCGEGSRRSLVAAAIPGRASGVAVGPEGDFHPDEIEAARRAGFEEVDLGPARLRTETAAVVAVHLLNLAQRKAAFLPHEDRREGR